jgi:hypothetical protein
MSARHVTSTPVSVCCCQRSLSASGRNTAAGATALGSRLQQLHGMLLEGTPGRPSPELPGTSGHVPAVGRCVGPATARRAPELLHSADTKRQCFKTALCSLRWINSIKSLPFYMTTFNAGLTNYPDKHTAVVLTAATALQNKSSAA